MTELTDHNLLPQEFSVGPTIINLNPELAEGNNQITLLIYVFDNSSDWKEQFNRFRTNLVTCVTSAIQAGKGQVFVVTDFTKGNLDAVGAIVSSATGAILDRDFVAAQKYLSGQVILIPSGHNVISGVMNTFRSLTTKGIQTATTRQEAQQKLEALIRNTSKPEV